MDIYDIRYPAKNSSTQIKDMIEYLNDPDVVSQLHAESSWKDNKFEYINMQVNGDFANDVSATVLNELKQILKSDLNVLVYSGCMDSMLGCWVTQDTMTYIEWEYMKEYQATPAQLYYYKSDDYNPDEPNLNKEYLLGGNYRQYRNLNYLSIYNAGHLAPTTQLALTRNMLQDMIQDHRLVCHDVDRNCTTEMISCTYMNNCNHNGECIEGTCQCKDGFFGADCSIKVWLSLLYL